MVIMFFHPFVDVFYFFFVIVHVSYIPEKVQKGDGGETAKYVDGRCRHVDDKLCYRFCGVHNTYFLSFLLVLYMYLFSLCEVYTLNHIATAKHSVAKSHSPRDIKTMAKIGNTNKAKNQFTRLPSLSFNNGSEVILSPVQMRYLVIIRMLNQ